MNGLLVTERIVCDTASVWRVLTLGYRTDNQLVGFGFFHRLAVLDQPREGSSTTKNDRRHCEFVVTVGEVLEQPNPTLTLLPCYFD